MRITASTEPSVSPNVSSSRVFAGWWVVASVFVLLTATSGLGFYGLAVYLEALTAEQGFSTTSVSLATAMFFVISGVAGRLVAPVIEARDIRWTIGVGGLISAGSLWSLGSVDSVIEMYAVYAVFSVGFALAGLVPATTLVTRWFHARRSVALAVASTGLSVGGITLTVWASGVIDARGLSDAADLLAVVYLVLVAVTLPTMWPSPQRRGLQPDGAAPGDPQAASAGASVDYRSAVGSRFFKVMVVGSVLCMGAQVGAIAHVAKLGTERVDRPAGALAVSALAAASIVARLIGGVIVERMPMMTFTVVLAVIQGASFVALAFADSKATLLAGAILFGLTVGNLLMLQPLIVAAAFGVQSYPRIFALQQLLVTAGIAAGPVILGSLHDLAGYRASYLAAAAISTCGGIVWSASGTMRPSPETVV